MKIVVCITLVPATTDAKIDPETKRIIREGVKAELNPFDTYGVEEAVQLRNRFGGEVITLSMGPPSAVNSLRETISVGADKAILLSDRALGGSDTWATSYALAKAIDKIGDVDLVICGKQAVDGDTAQVGPGIAAHLDWMQATYVNGVEKVTDDDITVERMHEDGYDICELELPAVITVVKGINTPRVPTLRGRLASEEVEIITWNAEDIKADPEKIGLMASPTRVVKTNPPPPRQSSTIRITGSSEKCAKELFRELRLRSIL
ncbi:MAG: electron transfer flavoprotein subunit beta/FixA family protein [Clostridia bacterium]|nr:electron transfer flavoprotein subunit beta/FixA family protein [Clostridia bacterium]